MTDRLDAATLRALRDEALDYQRAQVRRVNSHGGPACDVTVWKDRAAWLQAKLDALPKEPGADWTDGVVERTFAPRIPPDLAGALREWREWISEYRTQLDMTEQRLAAAIDAARKDGWL